MAASDAWYDSCERSPAHYMAKSSGTTVGRAVSVLETAEMLKELPATEQAFRQGKLSESQAIEVAFAAVVDRDAEQALLEAAEVESLRQLQRQCQRVRAAAMDEEQKHHRAHRRRRLRHWVDLEGVFHLEAKMTTQSGAVVMAALEPFHHQVVKRAKPTPVKESDGALMADALVEMAEQSKCGGGGRVPAGPQAMVHVRVDHGALTRGYTQKGEICEVPGVGPIPVSALPELAGDAFWKAILVDGHDVLRVAHMGRTIPAHLRTAVVERDQVCVVSGCDKMRCLEFDHVHERHKLGPTSLVNMVRMCHWHHYLKTYHRHRLKRHKGRWLLLPPDKNDGEPKPVQPELTGGRNRLGEGSTGSVGGVVDSSGHPSVFVEQKNRIREVPGTAPPRKRRRNRGGPYGLRPIESLPPEVT